jgi:glycosyltransferase involved in cell wall biosynthesis
LTTFVFGKQGAENMVIGLVAPPFIAVPPPSYGRTELFVANLAEGLARRGHQVIVYANGESNVGVKVYWIYPGSEAPASDPTTRNVKEMKHFAWAMQDAANSCDIVHINSAIGLPHSSLLSTPIVLTLADAHDPTASELYACYPNVHYVCNSRFRAKQEKMPYTHLIAHGIDLAQYPVCVDKKPYLSFLGRIAPIKGTHLAIAVAELAGMPLKIAGPIQPDDEDYFEAEIKPHVDGSFIDYVGEVNHRGKTDLLGESVALLFPIQWDEPFGLVMAEAMACGTPVLAFPAGAVEETVKDGVNGNICNSVEDMAQSAQQAARSFSASAIRRYAEKHFSLQRMAESYEALYMSIIEPGGVKAASSGFSHSTTLVSSVSNYIPPRGLPGKGCSSARKLILCIDDNVEQLQLEKAILQVQGYDVLTANNGRAGLALLKQSFIDGVVLDYSMPEMDGRDVALEIRRMHLTIPIIVVSGSDISSLPELLFELINGFVPKGSPPDQLLSLLKQFTTTTTTALAS